MAEVLYKGVEWRRRITVTDEDTGALTNLAGKAIVFQLRRRSGMTPLVDLSVGSGITLVSGGASGEADIVISAGASVSWESASHVITALVDGQVVLPPTKVSVRPI